MESIYRQLQRKLNTMGLGLPESDKGYELKYLAELFTEEEADFALKMELGVQTPEEVAVSMGITVEDAADRLESMAKRSIIFRVHDGDVTKYTLFPIIHGFLEFNVDRFNEVIADNFGRHYMDGVSARFYGSKEPLFRILPLRRDIVADDECLSVDDVEAIIRKQDKIAITECFCRLSTETGARGKRKCKHNPEYSEMCMVFGVFADFYVENGNAKWITADQALEHIHKCDKEGNVVEVLNTNNVEVMCSCCSCCCGVVKSLKYVGGPSAKFASNYKVDLDSEKCVKCGLCTQRCPMKSAVKDEEGNIVINHSKCAGCGLCVTTCPTGALTLRRKPEEELYYPPKDSVIELYDHIRDLRRQTHEI